LKLLRDARTLKGKSISSLKTAMTAFNSYDDEGRVTMVLMHLQHASEMLLKAVLVQRKVKVFDRESGMSISFDRCIRLCSSHHGLKAGEAGIMRAIDTWRNAAQHWFLFVSEDLLYLHTRALITAFDAYLKRTFETDLHSHIPPRVLPVSTKPPGDFEFLVDREYQLIGELLEPGRRKRDEARGRIRSMLAMEAMVADQVEVSERDIDRIERAVRAGQVLADVFPRLTTVGTSTEGEGTTFTVRFAKKEGAPVRFVGGDDPEAAAAIREVDLQKRFHLRPKSLAERLGISTNKAKAMRDLLGIDEDPACHHVFEFDGTRVPSYSDNAVRRMREAIEGGRMDEAWAARTRGRKGDV
jgi:hypothetical protein